MKTTQIIFRPVFTYLAFAIACLISACDTETILPITPAETTYEVQSLSQLVSSRDPESMKISLDMEGRAIDAFIKLENLSDQPVRVRFAIENDSILPIKKKSFQVFQLGQLREIEIIDPSGNGIEVQLDIKYAETQDAGHNFDIDKWKSNEPVCLSGKGTYQASNERECLFEKETVWTSAVPRTVSLNFALTGETDVTVDIEYSNNTISSYNASAAPAQPQFQSVVGEWEDVIAVYITGKKNAVNGCAPLQIEGSLCYE